MMSNTYLCLICARHYAKEFVNITTFNPHDNTYMVDKIITKKLR